MHAQAIMPIEEVQSGERNLPKTLDHRKKGNHFFEDDPFSAADPIRS